MGKQRSENLDSLGRFANVFVPLEKGKMFALTDKRTGAIYCECHVRASVLSKLATTDVPLDPDEQSEYRANRSLVVNHPAFQKMKDDARLGRAFSNIVAEYTTDYDPQHPLKIIGGQHRFEAIKESISGGSDEWHGLKVYVDLSAEQRLDVQLISNTNIAISEDLFDRMHETVQGPQLRDWCQAAGLLPNGEDFADHRERGGPIPVRLARAFISNFYKGREVDLKQFNVTDTTPILCPSGQYDPEWENLRKTRPELWNDARLLEAGREFAGLVAAQRRAFENVKPRPKPDFPDKPLNAAVLSAWAYVAGLLQPNETRLRRHYTLRNAKGKDPLNVAQLVKGKHKSDPENYRGLGYRTDPRERGRFVELFHLQAERGDGISFSNIDVAIKQFHAKQAQLEVIKARGG